MALSARDRVLYTRQLLLAEIGCAGQERLCATVVAVPAQADGEAGVVARDYLERAGLTVRSEPASTRSQELLVAPVADATAVETLAGAPELRHAAATLLGAFAATEVIKLATGCGCPATFPASLSFVSEDA